MESTFLDVPSRGFRAKVYPNNQRNRGDEGGSQLQPPCNIPNVVNCQVGAETQEDAKRGPHLPAHDQASSDRSWAILGSIDGNSGSFGAHFNTKEKTGDKKLLPVLAEGRPGDGNQAEDGGEEDDPTPAQEEVEWV